MFPDRPTVPLEVRLSIATVMVAAAIVATGIVRPDSIDGILSTILAVFLFPTGLMYAFHEPGGAAGRSDGEFAFSLIGPYFIYACVLTAVALVKSRVGFVVVCIVLAVLLSLNVKGCASAQHIRWMSS